MNQTIILGPPGCGKTTHLLNLVDQEMQSGTHPSRIGYFSFTKKATQEAVTRACDKFKCDRADLPYFRTLHSLAFQELGLGKLQVMGSPQYTALGEALGLEFSAYMDMTEGIPMSAKTGDQVLYMVGMAAAKLITLEEQYQSMRSTDVQWFALKQFADTLAAFKADTGMLDFSDMISRYCDNCEPLDIEVAFIDEAQDLSKQQWSMIQYATMRAKRVYIAGDDDQAIYRWSGADVDSFMELEGEKIVLNQSYRLPQTIHKLCSGISRRISRRFDKQWKPRQEVGTVDHLSMLEHLEWKDGSYLFLARNRYLLASMEEFVRRSGIPYTSLAKSSINADTVRGIVLWERLRRGDAITVPEARVVYACIRSGEGGIKRGFKLLKNLADEDTVTMDYLRKEQGLVADGIWHDALTAIPAEELEFYLAAKRRGEKLNATPRVHISTIHGVKGGEADHVVVLSDMAWRTFNDYQRDPDDEHRVAYVAASRARQTLSILMPQTTRAYRYD